MDQQQIIALYSQWDTAKEAGDVTSMIALIHRLPSSVTRFAELANCTGFKQMVQAKTPLAAAPGYAMLKDAQQQAEFMSLAWIKATVNCAWGSNILQLFKAALKFADLVLAHERDVLKLIPESVVYAYSQSAYALHCLDSHLGAYEAAKRASRLASEHLGADSPDVVWAICMQAVATSNLGRPTEGLTLLEDLYQKTQNEDFHAQIDGAMAACLLPLRRYQECISRATNAVTRFTPKLCGGQEWRMKAELHRVLAEAHTACGSTGAAQVHLLVGREWMSGRGVGVSTGGD